MTTKQFVARVGCKVGALIQAIRNNRVPAPGRDDYGYYRWEESDVETVRRIFATDRRFKKNRQPRPTEGTAV